jgi:ethanolamine transporter EutH
MDFYFGTLDGKRPAAANHVPIKFIISRKKTKLTCGVIFDYIFMDAGTQQHICNADFYALAAGNGFNGKILSFAIAFDILHRKIDVNCCTVLVSVGGWKIPEYAMTNFTVFGQDSD